MSSQKVKDWRVRTKARIIEAMGGKCNLCNYNRCNSALELHHINPSEKKFSLASVRGHPKAWTTIVEELRKCVLLCANCHREIEANVVSLPKNINSFNEVYADYKVPPVIYEITCHQCNHIFRTNKKNRKFCSPDCAYLSNRKTNRPSKEELKFLIETMSWVQIGKQFGVADNSVRKWATSYGLV